MTREEAIEIIKTERECVERNTQNECDRDCINCDLLRADEEIFSAYDMAIEALKEPKIVHCKDCKYWIRTRIGEEELNQCGLAGYLIGGRGYCLYGKAGEQG